MPQGAAMAPGAAHMPAFPGAQGSLAGGQAAPTPAPTPGAPGAPSGQDFARYQPTAPSTGDTVDTGWVTTKGSSSGRLQKEWHMTVYREWPIPEGLKWVPTAWKWFYYILMTTVFAVSFYYGIYLRF